MRLLESKEGLVVSHTLGKHRPTNRPVCVLLFFHQVHRE
jgi:hypothetical protein